MDTTEKGILQPPLNKRVLKINSCWRCIYRVEDLDEDGDFWFCERDLAEDGELNQRYYIEDRPDLPYHMTCDRFTSRYEGED